MSEYSNLIKQAFSSRAWAYSVMYHGVAIGVWDGNDVFFHKSAEFDWAYVTELRIFNNERELRFIRNEDGVLLVRDNINIDMKNTEKQCAAYLMYGTNAKPDGGDNWTVLTEERGGLVYFPKKKDDIGFEKLTDGGDEIVLWLGIRNYLRFTDDLRLEVFDYSFTGFKKGMDKREVEI